MLIFQIDGMVVKPFSYNIFSPQTLFPILFLVTSLRKKLDEREAVKKLEKWYGYPGY